MDVRIVVLVPLLVMSAARSYAQDKYTIYPGQGIGTIRIGSLEESVTRDIGFRKPSEIRKVLLDNAGSAGRAVEMWLSYQDLGLTFVYDAQTRVLRSIVVTNPIYRILNSGTKVGDQRARIPGDWRDGRETSQNPNLNKVTYTGRGIEFWIDSADTIIAIVVFSLALNR